MDTVMKYTFAPMQGLFKSIERSMMIAGYRKAAAELNRLGYYEEAKQTMKELQKLQNG